MATGSSSFSSYGDFFIYVVDNSGKESPKSYYSSLQASTSSTIKLSANKTYTITICPQAKFTTNRKLTEQGKFRYRLSGDSSFTWSKVPTWTITAYNVLSLKNIKTTIAPQQ